MVWSSPPTTRRSPATSRKRTREGIALNLNVLGEAILSDAEAEQRIARVIATLQRPDVDYISVKISAICALLDVYAFEHSVERISAALRRIYDAAIASSAADVRQPRHGGVRRPRADRRVVRRACSTSRRTVACRRASCCRRTCPTPTT